MSMLWQTTSSAIPAGEFLPPPSHLPHRLSVATRLTLVLLVALLVLTAGSVAGLLLRLASILLPVALIAALVAYAAFRIQFGARRAG
jgi:hypothetical protein